MNLAEYCTLDKVHASPMCVRYLVQDDDVAAEEEKVLSGSIDANDVVVIKDLMKVRQGSMCLLFIIEFIG